MVVGLQKTHIIHAEIYRIVIDVLIELSKKCVEEPHYWPNYLIQVATRVSSISEAIYGGSLYLIKGFKLILECSDYRLRELQKTILELITDISTPEVFSLYLAILASDSPPIDLLLPKLLVLSKKTYQIQPNVEITFPTINGKAKMNNFNIFF